MGMETSKENSPSKTSADSPMDKIMKITKREVIELMCENSLYKLEEISTRTDRHIKYLSDQANQESAWREHQKPWEPDYKWRERRTEFGKGII